MGLLLTGDAGWTVPLLFRFPPACFFLSPPRRFLFLWSALGLLTFHRLLISGLTRTGDLFASPPLLSVALCLSASQSRVAL
jgi:hypothetical protein